MKWLSPVFVYLAVAVGLFGWNSAWGALLAFHFAILISILIARPSIPVKVLITSTDRRWILLSVLVCGSSGLILYFLWDNFGIAPDLTAYLKTIGLNSATWIPFIVYFTLVNPLIEEYYWRGYLGSDTTGLYISDFLYSGFHGLLLVERVQTVMILFGLAVLVAVGWFWRQIARLDKGLLAPVLGHMAADLSLLLAVYWKVT